MKSGTKFGPYEIVNAIGAGGMGEVWRAKDTRLDRDVAIKILPPGFAADENLRQRFEREAKAISQLNHPNICTLFDVGVEDDVDVVAPIAAERADSDSGAHGPETAIHYLVMELIEGESLADRLEKGPLSLHEVLRYGREIASALDAAHRQGITHRDLKPGNVMLTRSGAKLLDFGLAKSVEEGSAPLDSLTNLPTEAKPLTQEGTIIGTFQYMAPEQLEGLEADHRTDIFALGALVYEMATGQRTFQGKSKTSLIAAIVTSQPPPLSSLAPMTPPALDHVIRRCLEKDPEDRWQSAHDVASELQWIGEAGSQAGVAAPIAIRRKTRERLAWGIAAFLLLVAIGAFAWALTTRQELQESHRPFRAELLPPDEFTMGRVQSGTISISRDGSRIILIGTEGGLLVRDLETGETLALEGTENAIFPFWSPDGSTIAFFADGKLKKTEAGGGPIQILADAPQGRGGTWSTEGLIIFAPDIEGPLMTIPAGGGKLTALTKLPGEKWTHRNPHVLPDGRHVLYTTRETRVQQFGSIAMISVDGGEEITLVGQASNPQYASGYLFWVRDGNLLAQPFDASTGQLSGAPTPLADGVEYYNPRDIGNFSVSTGGTLAWRRSTFTPRQLVKIDQSGRELETYGEPGLYILEDVDREGRQALLARLDSSQGTADLWLMDLARNQTTRVSFTSSKGVIGGSFSPDGTQIAVSGFGGTGGSSGALWIQSTSGSGEETRLRDSTDFLVDQWSGDGRFLVGDVQETKTAHDIAYLAIDDPTTIRKFAATPFEEDDPRVSPDGNWIVWLSDESGQLEIYLSDFPDAKRKWQVSKGDPQSPAHWTQLGDAIYFMTSEGLIRVAATIQGNELELGSPEIIEDLDLSGDFFLLPDSHLLTLKSVTDGGVEPIRIIRNWEQMLKE